MILKIAYAILGLFLLHMAALGLLHDICNCAHDYALTNLWRE